MHGHQPDQYRIHQINQMSASLQDIFRLNPHQRFAYTDFVIRAPRPRIPQGMPAETAKRKYPRTRLKRLMRVVEARLGRRRCFFSECQPKDQKQESQFEVSKLYALYEVEHWPGVFAQLDWTQFVMANIERDALRNEYGPTVKLTLPVLPSSAVPIYQEMLRQESRESAWIDANSDPITGVTSKGEIYTYPAEDSRRQALCDRSNQQHERVWTSFMPQLSSSPHMRDALFELSSEQLGELVRNDQIFRDACEFHQRVVQKELRQMCRFYLRCIGRQPGMHLLTWQEVVYEARMLIKMTFIQQLEIWRRQQPGIQFNYRDVTGTIVDLQLKYLISCIRHYDPIPAQAAHQFQKELNRKHQIAAMLRQRRILREWTTTIAKRSSMRDGQRYRREGEHVMDMWTGTVEEYEAFNERNRKDNTVLTADMLPMATQLRVRAPRAQVQTRGGNREKQQSLGGVQLPVQMQEEVQEQRPAQRQQQPQTQTPVQTHVQESYPGQKRPTMEQADVEPEVPKQGPGQASSQDIPQQQEQLPIAATVREQSQEQTQPPEPPHTPPPGLKQVRSQEQMQLLERMKMKALGVQSPP